MLRSGLFSCLTLLLFTAACKGETPLQKHAGDERIISEMESEMSKAIAGKDIVRLLAGYAENAAVYSAEAPAMIGKNAIRESYRSGFQIPGFEMTSRPWKIEVSDKGDMAWVHGYYSKKINNDIGRLAPDRGTYVAVYEKKKGNWKIAAESGRADFRSELPMRNKSARPAPNALMTLLILLWIPGGLFFLFCMPIIAAVFALRYFCTRKITAGLLLIFGMLIGFYLTALLLWTYFSIHYWNLSFLSAVQAAGDSERYGHDIEHTAEVLVFWVVIVSVLVGTAAGAITGTARYFWAKRPQQPAFS